MCNLHLSNFICPPKSFLAWVWGFPALGGVGTTTLKFLTSLSAAAGVTHVLFPLPLTKSLYRQLWSVFCACWLHTSYQLRFHWLLGLFVGRSANNLSWGQEQAGGQLLPTWPPSFPSLFFSHICIHWYKVAYKHCFWFIPPNLKVVFSL